MRRRATLAVSGAGRSRSAGMDRGLVLVLAAASGLVVANSYYAQPLLAAIADTFDASTGSVGLVVTASQIGYAIGLAFLVPLGDLVDRRGLLTVLLGAATIGLVAMALAPSWELLGLAGLLVGVASVVGQVLVPLAATLAGNHERGHVIGSVMTGLLLGILLSRVVAGLVAQVAGWRSVFWLGAVLMVLTGLWLRRQLPHLAPTAQLSYRRLLASVVRLVREERVLRNRMAYGAATYASFGVFWTSVAFLLAGPHYGWNDATIGLFTLFGVAGAIAAKFAGVLADRGHARLQTGLFIAATAASFALLALGSTEVVALAAGVALLELGIQGTHITNQHEFYALRPDARSRLNTAYMTAYFAAGSAASGLSALFYDLWGWGAVCALGAVFPLAGLVVWLLDRTDAAPAVAAPRQVTAPS